jgi:hypothetical protein
MLVSNSLYSQEHFVEKLEWKEKKKLVNELREEMKSFVNDTVPVVVRYFNGIFSRKKIDKQLTLQKLEKQKQTKNYIDSNFVVVNDYVIEFCFKDRNQIIEWGKNVKISPFMPIPIVQSKELNINDNRIFILMIDKCSGMRCLSMYVFVQERENWKLTTCTDTNIEENISLRIDNGQKKIIFETKVGQIGELLFEKLLPML